MKKSIHPLLNVPEIELHYKSKVPAGDQPIVNHAQAAYDILISAWDKNKIELVEQAYVLLMNRGNACLGISHISTGGMHTCVVDPRIIFVTALKANASKIILAHNHPSGSPAPSKGDILVTEKVIECGHILDIQLLDHLIITSKGFYSMLNEGILHEPKPSP